MRAAALARNRVHLCSGLLRSPLYYRAFALQATVSMASRPSTPPAELPADPKSWRFKDTGADCEWVEEYRPGGFHPVELGDTLHSGSYRVIRKLGNGSFSTVWLAVDTRALRYVALKIMTAKASSAGATELAILAHLSAQAQQDANARHLTVLLDSFTHVGPNGAHQCMVFEPMGATAASLVDELSENKPRRLGHTPRYPVWLAKRILLHTLRGLAFLHAHSVVHADVQPGNIMFAIGDLSAASDDELKHDENGTEAVIPVERLDGKVDHWAPKKLYRKQPLHNYVQLEPSTLQVKLSDLGAAFWEVDPLRETATPLGLRAPELILHRHPYTRAIDIWSFGCLIYEFMTGKTLFAVMEFGPERDAADEDHLLQLHDVLGTLPDDIMAAWPRAGLWFGPERERLPPPHGGELYVHDSLELRFGKDRPDEIDDEEAAVVCALIRRALAFEPAKRPTAAELLDHPWFSEQT